MNETVLVTGATGLIGSVITKSLIEKGYNVVAVSRSLERVRSQLALESNRLRPLIVDLSADEAVTTISRLLKEEDLQITSIVHAARDTRTLKKRSLIETNDWLEEYRLAAVVPYQLIYELKNDHPLCSVVLISSMYGIVAQNPSLYDGNSESFAPHYAASKAALIHLTKQLAVEIAPAIRVNCVSYGGVQGRADKAFQQKYAAFTPQGGMLTEDDLAGPVTFLIDKSASSGITGSNVVVDGGWSIW